MRQGDSTTIRLPPVLLKSIFIDSETSAWRGDEVTIHEHITTSINQTSHAGMHACMLLEKWGTTIMHDAPSFLQFSKWTQWPNRLVKKWRSKKGGPWTLKIPETDHRETDCKIVRPVLTKATHAYRWLLPSLTSSIIRSLAWTRLRSRQCARSHNGTTSAENYL